MERFRYLKKENIISFFIVFFIFDLLYLPYFLASTPLSFFLLILLSPFLFTIEKKQLIAYLLLVFCLISSVINGLTIYTVGAEDNLKRLIQMSLVLSLIFLNVKKIDFFLVERLLNMIFLFFILYLFVLLVMSLTAPELYLSFIGVVSPNDIEIKSANVEMFRFSYIFSDPNTLGYLLVFTSIYYLFYARNSNFALFVFSILFCLVLSTQSRGSLLAFMSFISMFVISRSKFSLKTIKIALSVIGLFTLILFVFQDFFLFVIEAFEKRAEIEEAMGTGMGGGRDKKYIYLLNNLNFHFYGVGYSLLIDGLEFRPHSDLIRMILSYGIFFPFLFFFLFVPNNLKSSLLLFSFMFPFLLNTVVDDYRLFGLFVILFIFMKCDKRLLD